MCSSVSQSRCASFVGIAAHGTYIEIFEIHVRRLSASCSVQRSETDDDNDDVDGSTHI